MYLFILPMKFGFDENQSIEAENYNFYLFIYFVSFH